MLPKIRVSTKPEGLPTPPETDSHFMEMAAARLHAHP